MYIYHYNYHRTCSTGFRSSFSFLSRLYQVREIIPQTQGRRCKNLSVNLLPFPTGAVFGIGFLEITSEAATKHIGSGGPGGGEVKLLNALTEPLTKLVVQVKLHTLNSFSLFPKKQPCILRYFHIW
jgi:hypothetical protein